MIGSSSLSYPQAALLLDPLMMVVLSGVIWSPCGLFATHQLGDEDSDTVAEGRAEGRKGSRREDFECFPHTEMKNVRGDGFASYCKYIVYMY